MTRRGRAWSALGSAAALVAAVGLALANPAAAHSQLVSSSPQDGAVLATAPTEVVFTFDEDLLPGVDTIAISDADGTVLSSTKVEPQGAVVRAPWPAGLPDGTYQAAYRIVSADGHPVSDAILVTIDSAVPSSAVPSSAVPSSAVPSSAVPSSAVPSTGGSSPLLVAGVWLLTLAAAASLLWLARRRRGTGGRE